jgi:hypothetical protein
MRILLKNEKPLKKFGLLKILKQFIIINYCNKVQESFMKKIIVCLLTFITLMSSIYAADNSTKNENNWSTLSYENIPVLKVLDSKYGYMVIYQKHKLGTGSTFIPKDWAKYTSDTPRKLKIRTIKNPQEAFLTVIKDDGEFKRVILSIPKSKSNSLWGVMPAGSVTADDAKKDTLEELDL